MLTKLFPLAIGLWASVAIAGPSLDLNATTAAPGTTAAITVTLTRNGSPVAGTGNDIKFDSAALGIVPATDCALDDTTVPSPPFHLAASRVCSSGSGICTLDSDCTGSRKPPCNIVRVGVFEIGQTYPQVPIATDGVVVTCDFTVGLSAHGTYVLSNKPSTSDGWGNAIRGTTGVAGSVTVP